jgi:hypothetical protein
MGGNRDAAERSRTSSLRKAWAERMGDKSLKKKLRQKAKKAEKRKLGRAVDESGHHSRESKKRTR